MSPVPASFLSKDERIKLSPWSAQHMDQSVKDALEARAAELGAIVSTVYRARGEWLVRWYCGDKNATLVGRGTLEAVVAGALDDAQEAAA